MHLDLDKVRTNAEKTTVEELLDRVTVFRGLMEPEAVEVIEQVLWRRGVGPERVAAYGREASASVIRRSDGSAEACSYCPRAAVARGWGWHRFRGGLPIFPRPVRWCPDHKPKKK
jgi:hypothetical protein